MGTSAQQFVPTAPQHPPLRLTTEATPAAIVRAAVDRASDAHRRQWAEAYDRRADHRHPFRRRVGLSLHHRPGELYVAEHVLWGEDLSDGGMSLIYNQPLGIGQLAWLDGRSLGGPAIAVPALIVRCEPLLEAVYEIGVRFSV